MWLWNIYLLYLISGWYDYVPNIWLIWLCTQYLVGIVMYPISGWYGYVPNIWLVWLCTQYLVSMVNKPKCLVGIVVVCMPNVWLVWLCTHYLVGIVMYPISGWCGRIPNMSRLLWFIYAVSLTCMFGLYNSNIQ